MATNQKVIKHTVKFAKTEAAFNKLKELEKHTGIKWIAYDKGDYMLVVFELVNVVENSNTVIEGGSGSSYLLATLDEADDIRQHMVGDSLTVNHYSLVE